MSKKIILFSFVLDGPPGYKVFCEPETIHYKKFKKSVVNTITFYLKDDDHKEGNLNGSKLTFNLQLVNFYFHFSEKIFRKIETYSSCVGQKHYAGTENIVGEITFNKNLTD